MSTGQLKPNTPGAMAKAGRIVKAAAARVANVLLPPVCLACRKPLAGHHELCGQCWSTIDFIHPPVCERLGLPLPFDAGPRAVSAAALAKPPAYDRARAVASYDGIMRRLIHELKYSDRQDAAGLFGRWLARAAGELLAEAPLIVPVPLARWRLFQRRFNQAAVLAHALGAESGLETDMLVLKRTRRTESQVGLSADQRRRNVAGAFAVCRKRQARLRGRRVLLVDDVITTGATVEACTRTLRKAGAGGIDVVALARVTDPLVASA